MNSVTTVHKFTLFITIITNNSKRRWQTKPSEG